MGWQAQVNFAMKAAWVAHESVWVGLTRRREELHTSAQVRVSQGTINSSG